ncbi:MAG: hypothetical protein RLZ44_1871 [Pseudomonadota bacterium]
MARIDGRTTARTDSAAVSRELQKDKSLACLEADMAYFDARLSLNPDPQTTYQQAQVKTYHELRGIFEAVVEGRRQQKPKRRKPPRRP